MMMRRVVRSEVLAIMAVFVWSLPCAAELPDIRSLTPDLTPPPVTQEAPAPGQRVRRVLKMYEGTDVHHTLYLPTDWQAGRRYPVIVEYAGNGPFRNKFGDVCTGKVDDCNLGYGITGGKGFIVVGMPYVSADRKSNQRKWWGDVAATVAYCKAVVPEVCKVYGGESSAVFLAGFSRGAIACNYIGLHDEQIAGLWRGFICHSHYDGVRKWGYAGGDRVSAAQRLKRLGTTPQFISHEGSVEPTREYLQAAYPDGDFTFLALPFRNHTDRWALCDTAQRRAVRAWLRKVLATKDGR